MCLRLFDFIINVNDMFFEKQKKTQQSQNHAVNCPFLGKQHYKIASDFSQADISRVKEKAEKNQLLVQ